MKKIKINKSFVPKYALSWIPGFLNTFATKFGADFQSRGLTPAFRAREAVESFLSRRQHLMAPAAKGVLRSSPAPCRLSTAPCPRRTCA